MKYHGTGKHRARSCMRFIEGEKDLHLKTWSVIFLKRTCRNNVWCDSICLFFNRICISYIGWTRFKENTDRDWGSEREERGLLFLTRDSFNYGFSPTCYFHTLKNLNKKSINQQTNQSITPLRILTPGFQGPPLFPSRAPFPAGGPPPLLCLAAPFLGHPSLPAAFAHPAFPTGPNPTSTASRKPRCLSAASSLSDHQ